MDNQMMVLPEPRVPVLIRPATLADVAFIDKLQKLHNHAVGWMPTASLEQKIRAGNVIVAEENYSVGVVAHHSDDAATGTVGEYTHPTKAVGYCIGHDQYFKRDDVGIVYQMNVEPGKQRGLIGAALLKNMFERSAYGCKLFCCWCAQDLAANKFWEAMGFVPLAYRAGGESKGKEGSPRIHIFWQKRIRSGDVSTPFWFPAKTTGGALQADRIVLPIPPGMKWSEVSAERAPIVMPMLERNESTEIKALPGKRATKKKEEPKHTLRGVLYFKTPATVAEKPTKCKRKKVKNDPKFVAAARELRDRWMEQVNGGKIEMIGNGKYELGKGTKGVEDAIEGVVVNRMIAA